MSSVIDNRIVSLKFDNKQFEQNAKTSMNTLERLKASLNFDTVTSGLAKGFSNVEQSLSMGNISNSIDNIANRFSAMGIVGATVISNLTTQVMNLATRLGSLAINPLVEGGKTRALNIEHAKFQLEGLGVAWDKIEQDISYGVQDTAYGLDAAATVASQLVASNVQLGDSMKTALRGVSGVAAMTSSSYEDIGHIFTTVAGQGRLMGMQLTQLSMKGINAAATLGNALGKSEADIRDMVSKGQIDFATFAKAMDDAYGAHAKDANKTFTGAMSNTRAALSRIGAKFATPAYENLKDVLNALIPVINAVNKSLDPFVELAEKGMKKASENISKALENFGKVGGKTKKATEEFNKLDDLANRVLKGEFGNGEERRKQLENLGVSYDEVQSKVNELLGGTKTANTETNVLVGIVKNFSKVLSNTAEGLGKVTGAIKDAFDSVFTDSVLDRMDKFSEKVSKFSEKFKMSDETAKKFKKTFEGLFGLFKLTETAVLSIVKALTPVANFATEIFGSVFDGVLNKLSTFGDHIFHIVSISKKGDYFYNNVKRIVDIFRRDFSPLIGKFDVFKDTIKNFFSSSYGILNKVAIVLRNLFTKDYDNYDVLAKWNIFAKTIEKIGEAFVNVGTAVVAFVKPLKDAIVEAFPKMLSVNVLDIATAISNFTEKLVISDKTAENIKHTFEGFLAVFRIVGQLVSAVIRTLFPSTNALFSFGSGVASVTGSLGEWLVALADNLEENDTFYTVINKLVTLITTGFEKAKKKVEEFAQVYEEKTGKKLELPTFESISEFVTNLLTKVPEVFGKIKTWFVDFFKWFDEDESGNKGKMLDILVNTISTLSDLVSNSPDFSTFFDNLKKGFEKIDFGRASKILNIALFIVFLNALIKLKDAFYSLFNWNLYKNINGTFSALKGAFAAASRDIQASVYVKIAQAVALLAGSLIALSAVDGTKLTKALVAVTAIVILLQTFNPNANLSGGAFGLSVMVIAIATAIAILSATVASIGSLDVKVLANGLMTVISLFAAIVITANGLPEGSGGTLLKASVAMVIFAMAIKSMANSLEQIGNIENAGQSFAILAGAIAVFVAAVALIGGISTTFPHVVLAFSAFSSAMIAMSISIVIFAQAMKTIDNLENAWMSFAIISATIGLFCSAIALFGGVTKAFPTMMVRFTMFASAMIAMSVAIVILANAMKTMDELNNAWRTIAVIASSMVIFISTMALFGAVTTAFPTMMVRFAMFASSMVTLSLAMILLSHAMKTISEIKDIQQTFGVFAGILAVFISSVVLLGAVSSFFPFIAAKFIALSVGIVVLSAALTLLAPALMALSIVSGGGAAKSLLALTGSLVAFAAVSVLLSAAIPVMFTLAKVFTVFSAGILSFGVGVAVLTIAITILSNHMNNIFKLFEALGPALTVLIDSVYMAISEALDKVTILIPRFGEVIALGIRVIGKVISRSIPYLVDCGILLILGILEGIESHIGDILTVTNSILEKLIEGLGAILPTLVKAGLVFIIKFINGLADAIRDNMDEVWAAIKNLISVIFEFVVSVIQSFLSGIPGVGTKIYDALEEVKNGIHSFFVPSQMEKTGKDGVDALVSGAESGGDKAKSAGEGIGGSFLSGLSSFMPDVSSLGENFGLDFGNSLGDTDKNAFNSGLGLGDSALDGIGSFSTDFSSLGNSMGIDFSNALGGTDNLAFDASSLVGDSAYDGLDLDFSSLGLGAGDTFSEGLSNTSDKASKSASSIADESKDAIDAKYDDFRASGNDLGKGFATGLFIDSRAEVYESAGKLARVALNSMRAELDINSPSKEGRQIGSFTGEGLSLGLLDMIGVVRNAGEMVAERAIESMRQPLLRVNDILASDIDVEPTIRPVVDLSNVAQSAALMNGLFTNRSFSIGSVSSDISRRAFSTFGASNQVVDNTRKDLNAIVRSISDLRGDIDTLGNRIGQMNMVLDTGTLVGAIAGPMDEELGRRYSFAKRGV